MTATSYKLDASNITLATKLGPFCPRFDARAVVTTLLSSITIACACAPTPRPDEREIGELYAAIQVYEAQQETASTALSRALSQAQARIEPGIEIGIEIGGEVETGGAMQSAKIALKAAADKICYTAELIRETDANLRCQTARRRAAQ